MGIYWHCTPRHTGILGFLSGLFPGFENEAEDSSNGWPSKSAWGIVRKLGAGQTWSWAYGLLRGNVGIPDAQAQSYWTLFGFRVALVKSNKLHRTYFSNG